MLSFGGFLNSTFWSSYRNQNSASIEEILTSKDCSVEKILEDEDCLQEFKNLNDKLIQYFDHEKLKQLVDLITVMPPENASQNRGHKFPFLANEIFNCEINALLDRFFDAPDPSTLKKNKSEPTPEATKLEHEEEEDSTEKASEEDSAKPREPESEHQKEEFPPSGAPNEEDGEQEESKKQEEEEGEKTRVESPKKEQESEETGEAETETEKKEQSAAAESNPAEVQKDTTSVEGDVEMKVEQEEPVSNNQETAATEVKDDEDTKMTEPSTVAEEDKKEESAVSLEETKEESKTKDEEDQEHSQFMLLERLMKFIRTKEKNLNPVLSGYFAKLLTLLLTRKQKSLLPFIFGTGSDVVDCLLNHVYQKSISEFINKLLNIQEDSVRLGNATLVSDVKQAQRYILNTLVEKLGPTDTTEEDNLNASSIIQDALETKEYYSVVAQKFNILKLLEYALPNPDQATTIDSQNSALGVLTQLASLYPERKKDKKSKQNDEDEEDATTVQTGTNKDSEDEEENSEGSIINLLARNVPRLVAYLEAQTQKATPEQHLDTSYDVKIVPLGSLRLKLIEFTFHLMKLNNETILSALAGTNFFAQLSGLLETYPWNNFLQLKSIAIFDEVLDSQNAEFRSAALSSSNIGQTLISMASKAKFDHTSNRTIRHGYMAVVVKIANQLITKSKDKDWVQGYLDSLGEDWRLFTEGELKRSNDTNSKSLGGQQPRPSNSDDDEMEGSMSMDSILSRFSNFNTEMTKRASLNSHDDDDDEDDEEEGSGGENGKNHLEDDEKDAIMKERDQEYESGNSATNVTKVMPTSVAIQGEAPLVKEYADNNYWKVDLLQEKSLEELMAEMEI